MSKSTALPCGEMLASVQLAGIEERLAAAISLAVHQDFAFENGHDVTPPVAAAPLRRVEPPAVEDELVARDEPLDVWPIGWLRQLRRDGPAGVVDRVE